MQARWTANRDRDRGEYARREEFVSVFESERVGLERLALLLTARPETAHRCVKLALRECVTSGAVSKGWILTWARRVVIRKAISLLMASRRQSFEGVGNDEAENSIVFSGEWPIGITDRAQSILDLPELDRLVFVMCVLEHYSIQDCALLLGRPPGEINVARRRAANRIGYLDEPVRSSQYFESV